MPDSARAAARSSYSNARTRSPDVRIRTGALENRPREGIFEFPHQSPSECSLARLWNRPPCKIDPAGTDSKPEVCGFGDRDHEETGIIGMTVVIIALLVAAGLASLVGGVMFTVAAFRRSTLWGLAVILIPFAGLVFLAKHWQDVKISVFIMAGGFAASCVAAIALPGLLADRAYEQASASLDYTEFRSEAPRGYRVPESSGVEADATGGSLFDDPAPVVETPVPIATPSPTPTPTPLPTATPTPQPTRRPQRTRSRDRQGLLPPSALGGHVGEYLALTLQDGREIKARLVSLRPTTLRVAQRIGGGEMEYTLPRDNVRGFRTLR